MKSPDYVPMALASGMKVSRRDQQIIGKIVKTFVDRSRKDIDSWRNAVKLAEHPEKPRRAKLQDLYHDLKSDGHLIAQRQIRKLAVLSKKFRIVNKATGEEDPDKTRLFQTPWFYKFMDKALDTVMLGTTVIEFGDLEESEFKDISVVPRRNVVPEQSLILLDISNDTGIDYSDPAMQLWVIEIGEKDELGLMADISQYLIWKKNALQAWAEFCDKFGIPFREATTNSRNPADVDRIEMMLEQMGAAGYGVFPEGTTMKIHDVSVKGQGNPFDAQVERMNSEISKAINGVTMLSDNGSSKSQGEVHFKVNDKIVEADATQLWFKINWDLIWLLNKHGYGLEGYEFQWDESEELSLKEQWDIIKEALQHYEIPPDFVSERFGFPIEAKKAKPLQPGLPAPKANFKEGLPGERKPLGPQASFPLYDLCCSAITNKVSTQDLNRWEQLFSKLFKRVYDQKPVADVPVEQYLKNASILNKAFTEGFSERLQSIEYDSPDHYRIAMMQASIFRFSAAATWQDVLQLNQLAGESKTFGEFKEKAESHAGRRLAHLEVEYNHTITTSQSAANWLRVSAPDEAELFDLEYQTVGDNRVRESHRLLDGTVAPVEDPIWNVIFVPNGWGDRCDIVQVPKGSKPYTDTSTLSVDSIPEAFRVNFGRSNVIFEKNHAYYKEFPDAGKLNRKNFGQPKWEDLDRSLMPVANSSIKTQKAFEKWWKKEAKPDGHVYLDDFLGRSFKLPSDTLLDKFKAREYDGQERYQVAGNVADILRAPDEVWLNFNNGDARYKATYLKNYKDRLLAVVVGTENEKSLDVITWFQVELEENLIGNHRNGILIKKR